MQCVSYCVVLVATRVNPLQLIAASCCDGCCAAHSAQLASSSHVLSVLAAGG